MVQYRYYVSPAGSGDKSGNSGANCHPYSSVADITWVRTARQTLHTAAVADPADYGLNIARVHTTVTQGIDSDYGLKSYVANPIQTATYGQICFATDQGEYVTPVGDQTWASYDKTCGGVAGLGTLASPHRYIEMTGWRSADNIFPEQVYGGVTTRTKQIMSKAAGSDQYLTTNYDVNRLWSGPTEQRSVTWTTRNPSPIRAVFRGSRTPDPRSDKTRQLWGAPPTSSAKFQVLDPDNLTDTESKVKYADGTTLIMGQGEVFDLDTKTLTPFTGTWAYGGICFSEGGSYVPYQGFEFHQFQNAFASSQSNLKFLSLTDIAIDNSKYAINRGSYVTDVEIARWQVDGMAQKMLAPGISNSRWWITDLVFHGRLVVGDNIQDTISVSSTMNAGPFCWNNCIVEWVWGNYPGTPLPPTPAFPAGSWKWGVYANGDGFDMESYGVVLKNCWVDHCADGAVDSKSAPYWLGWPAVVLLNCVFDHCKRILRRWPPTFPGANLLPGPWMIRDVTLMNPRQYSLFMTNPNPPFHDLVDWANPSGRSHFDGWSHGLAVSNDNTLGGDMDAILRRCYDARVGAAASNRWPQTNAGVALGGLKGPWRFRVWTPVADPPTLTLTVNGLPVDPGALIQVADQSVEQIQVAGYPSGSAIAWSITGPNTVISQAGDVLRVILLQAGA